MDKQRYHRLLPTIKIKNIYLYYMQLQNLLAFHIFYLFQLQFKLVPVNYQSPRNTKQTIIPRNSTSCSGTLFIQLSHIKQIYNQDNDNFQQYHQQLTSNEIFLYLRYFIIYHKISTLSIYLIKIQPPIYTRNRFCSPLFQTQGQNFILFYYRVVKPYIIPQIKKKTYATIQHITKTKNQKRTYPNDHLYNCPNNLPPI
eukprot:TRINITY_DN12108_c0_g2_i4.p2 TRINITY_DN12108_c0_g2~~TRINITY_DN12108_c0_g2_i4.p2  ORF type:complete len:198 (+),score=-28.20 TRINITY_DN12108_c0_g2_i4:484-1077(+)